MRNLAQLLRFNEKLSSHILYSQQPEQNYLSSLVASAKTHLTNHCLSGIFGLIIDSALRLPQQNSQSKALSAKTMGWRTKGDRILSPMEKCVNTLLSHAQTTKENRKYEVGALDWQVKLAVAFEMMRRQRFRESHPYLVTGIQGLEKEEICSYREYITAVIEFLKCCNYLGIPSEGESCALRALKHEDLEILSSQRLSDMQIALTDSLISQSKYSKAKEMLEIVQSRGDLSPYQDLVMSLRLSKIARRIDVPDVSTFSTSGMLERALISQDLMADVRKECLDELSSTLYSQGRKTNAQDRLIGSLIRPTMITANESDPMKDWRISHLHDQNARHSKLQITLGGPEATLSTRRGEHIRNLESHNIDVHQLTIMIFCENFVDDSVDSIFTNIFDMHDTYSFGNLQARSQGIKG